MSADPVSILSGDDAISRMRAAFDSLKTAFATEPYPDARARRQHLNQLKSMLLENSDALVEAISADFGNRAPTETLTAELLVSVEGVHYARRHVRRWMRPDRRKVGMLMASTRAHVMYQPKGVVGIIAPWNYPLFMVTGPLIYALAAGNRVMIKPSELTPRTSELLTQLCNRYFAADHVQVITGERDVGSAFAALPFDHLLFTGSTTVGRKIMHAAADNLTPVTLELGGKSPTIIDHKVAMEMAAERICFGKALNAGQTCVAPDYVLLPQARVDEFVSQMREAFSRMYPTLRDNRDYTSIVDDRMYRRLTGMLDDARAKGARLISLNATNEELPAETRKLPLTLVLDVSEDMQIMQEEIFGPILPVIGLQDINESLAYVNARPRPLAMNLFVKDDALRQAFMFRSHAGGVCVNDAVFHVGIDDLPFGGTGASGMGNYHGKEGFVTFSHAKGVFSRPRFNSAALLHPPYGGRLQKMLLRFFLR